MIQLSNLTRQHFNIITIALAFPGTRHYWPDLNYNFRNSFSPIVMKPLGLRKVLQGWGPE